MNEARAKWDDEFQNQWKIFKVLIPRAGLTVSVINKYNQWTIKGIRNLFNLIEGLV